MLEKMLDPCIGISLGMYKIGFGVVFNGATGISLTPTVSKKACQVCGFGGATVV